MRFIRVLGLVVGALLSASASADEASLTSADVIKSGVLRLVPGTSEILRTNPGVRTVIIGKPDIIEASVLADGVIAITAKAAGWTNMIVLDETQAVVLRTDVLVADVQVGPLPRMIKVILGDKAQSHLCTTADCIATPAASLTSTAVTPASGPYLNCAEVHAAGVAPLRRGEPGYGPHLDRDNDGVGCE